MSKFADCPSPDSSGNPFANGLPEALAEGNLFVKRLQRIAGTAPKNFPTRYKKRRY